MKTKESQGEPRRARENQDEPASTKEIQPNYTVNSNKNLNIRCS